MPDSLETVLVVLHSFGSYTKGQVISDPAQMADVRAAGRGNAFVVTQRPAGKTAAKKTEAGA